LQQSALLQRAQHRAKSQQLLQDQNFSTVGALPQFAIKNHTATLSLLPPLQWDREGNQKGKGKTRGLGGEQFNSMAKGEENSDQ